MENDTITLTHQNWRKVWRLDQPVIWHRRAMTVGLLHRVLRRPDQVVLNLDASGLALEGGEEFDYSPGVTLSWLMYPFSLDALVGNTFRIPNAYDSTVKDHVATFCYYEHNDMNDVAVKFLERVGNSFAIEVTGTADSPDANEPAGTIQVSIKCVVRHTDR